MSQTYFNHRRFFADLLLSEMDKNVSIVVCTGDLGYKMWDQIQEKYPKRFFNFGAAEQLMIGASVGMAFEGMTPVVYSITPFLLLRPFEFLRQYVGHEKVDIRLVGSGLDRDYSEDGFSHYISEKAEVEPILSMFGIADYSLARNISLDLFRSLVRDFFKKRGPAFLGLRR